MSRNIRMAQHGMTGKGLLARVILCLIFALALQPQIGIADTFAYGADVGWVTQEEAAGYPFYNNAGIKSDPYVLLQNLGVNAIRLRVWVNPAGGWCNGADVLYKAQRAAALGQRIMIDFHYSDTWADPGHQTKPAAWANDDIAQLVTDVQNHTTSILSNLKANNIVVDWVQVGNEINSGMLWPEGSTSNFGQLASLINSGYGATKAVYPNAKVIVHLANGYNDSDFEWFFDHLKAAGGKWDVIGMSHYPSATSWASYNSQIYTTMVDMVNRYGTPVMVAEVGMDWTQAGTTNSMLVDLSNKVKSLGVNGLGVFYWEPEAYPGWNNYNEGALNGNGTFTNALARVPMRVQRR